VAIFEGVDDAVSRKVVAMEGERPVKAGLVFQAAAAAFAMGRLLAALGAQCAGHRWQIGLTRGANQCVAAVSATEQAAARQQAGAQSPAEAHQPMGLG